MIVRNRSTKADHQLTQAEWQGMKQKNKDLFDIIDPSDEDISIPVVGSVIKPNEHKPKKRKNDN